jgi:hypothetical protein
MTRSRFKNRYVFYQKIDDVWVYRHDAKNWYVVEIYRDLSGKNKIECKIEYNGQEVEHECCCC